MSGSDGVLSRKLMIERRLTSSASDERISRLRTLRDSRVNEKTGGKSTKVLKPRAQMTTTFSRVY
jgi:hypothetical protein